MKRYRVPIYNHRSFFVESSADEMKKLFYSFTSQLEAFFTSTFAVCFLGFSLFFIIIFVGHYFNVPVEKLTRDPAAVNNYHPFIGIISNIGILIWCSSASICLFFAFFIKRENIEYYQFLLNAGILTSLLLLDDLFMFHDYIFPESLGISEKSIYVIYMLYILIFLLKFNGLILKSNYILFITGLFFFASSIAIDQLIQPIKITYFFEDGCKFLGIAAWASYFIRFCFSFRESRSYDGIGDGPKKLDNVLSYKSDHK